MRFKRFEILVEEIKTEDRVGSGERGRWETTFGGGETTAWEGYGYFKIEVVGYTEADCCRECLEESERVGEEHCGL